MRRMGSLLTLIFAVLPADKAQAIGDYQRYNDPNFRYVTTGHIPPTKRADAVAAMQFAIPSASKETLLDRQIPQRVGTSDVYRIDLKALGWDQKIFAKVTARDPYEGLPNALCVPADWLVYELADTTESTSYYDLLYGAKAPKTRDEFLTFWGVNKAQQNDLELGWIETRSQVSKQGTRFIQRFISNRGTVWVTQDVLKIERGTDPLEFPDGIFRHDGEESIAVTPKVSVKNRTRGAAQVYLLSNGQGKRIEEAVVDLVEDHFRTVRKQAAIVTSGSCIGCHQRGLNLPSVNGIESLLLQGVQFYAAEKKNAELVERFHLGTKGLLKEIERSNEDYADFVFACNGLKPEENSAAYRRALRDYETDLNLWRAAYELGATEDELKNALAYATAAKIDLGPRLAVLAQGGDPIARTSYAELYPQMVELLKNWRKK